MADLHTSPAPSAANLFVSGRLCLFGEHSDWAANYGLHGGYCLVTGTEQGFSASVRPSREFAVETRLPDRLGRPRGRTRRMSCPWDQAILGEAARDEREFFRYCAGVAHEMYGLPGVGGIDLTIHANDLPLRKGVSSSAAVCILVARAFDLVYDLCLFPHELMDIAYRGEKLTGSQCGRMDQACIYGRTPVLLSFHQDAQPRIEPIFPADAIHMFFVDLAGEKDTVRILNDLQAAYLESASLQRALGAENEQILRSAARALADGNAERLGALMAQAQELFDAQVAPHSPEQLASPLLHRLLQWEELHPHVYAGKGVGSQGDGTAQFVARSREDRDTAMQRIAEAFPDMQCFPLSIPPARGG